MVNTGSPDPSPGTGARITSPVTPPHTASGERCGPLMGNTLGAGVPAGPHPGAPEERPVGH